MRRLCAFTVAALLPLAGPGCGSTSPTGPTLTRPVLRLTAALPATATPGSQDLVVTLTGSGFVQSADAATWAEWQVGDADVALATTFTDPTHLTAVIPARLLAAPMIARIVVRTGDPRGDGPWPVSNAVTFDIFAPDTVLTALMPTSAVAGTADLVLTLAGNGFVQPGTNHRESWAEWSVGNQQTALATTFVDTKTLKAAVPHSLLASPGTAQVLVRTGDPQDDGLIPGTNPLVFTITAK